MDEAALPNWLNYVYSNRQGLGSGSLGKKWIRARPLNKWIRIHPEKKDIGGILDQTEQTEYRSYLSGYNRFSSGSRILKKRFEPNKNKIRILIGNSGTRHRKGVLYGVPWTEGHHQIQVCVCCFFGIKDMLHIRNFRRV